ncbi:MAG TPA: SRPBCC family protein [Dietzia timorensis]|uniref:SRPBCC family protein n=1 Tax=Dietzia timorensis TaxID=499555 RepID=A0A921JX31_9ACTN|nr:SRPBCC family protein [Dietzia timorensis]HJE89567.1 SRPBCC family protein [Dietzia timorensis]
MKSAHVSQVIGAPANRVYDFAAHPDNLPRWAAGLAKAEVRRDGDDLVVASPMGEVRVRFAPRNEYGVLDHDVALPSGEVVNNPLRVFEHPDGVEVVFTVRQLDASDDDFARDCDAVARDLETLRELVEG